MRLEYWLVLGLIVVGAICAVLLWYDICRHKSTTKLEQERREVREAKTKYYNADAVSAMNGK